jgi:nickel transport protein
VSRGALLAAALLAAAPAAAHEVVHVVERGRAVALRASYADGEPLAYCEAEVFSPADPRRPWQKGRTDRAGWVAFVPDVPGAWRVRVVDTTGHGLTADVQVDPAAAAPASAAPASAGGAPATIAFVLRPLLAIALIAVIFALITWRARRRAGR